MGEGVLTPVARHAKSPVVPNGFARRGGWLHVDDVPLEAIARVHGTPRSFVTVEGASEHNLQNVTAQA